MTSIVKHAVRLGLLIMAGWLLTACNRSAEPNVPLNAAGGADQTPVSTPSTSGTDAGNSASTSPNNDLKSAFPLVEPAKSSAAPVASNIPIQVVDIDEFRAVVEKHRGKVVLVDCWATWCGACKEQFPHTVELGQKYGERGLAVVSLSFDDPDKQPDVAAFLETQNANFDHLITKTGTNVETFAKFEIAGSALPYYKLYDRTGKLRYEFCGDPPTNLETKVEKIEDLDERLQELLAERS
jgi:thiol-disulfide isomerase/thioredoxin